MERLNLKGFASKFKVFLAALVFIQVAEASTNSFDNLKANKATVDYLQLDGNTLSSTGGNILIDPSNSLIFPDLTATTVPYLDSSKALTSSAITPTELGYLTGVSSGIQTQLDAKTLKSTLTNKGDLYVATGSATVTRIGVGSDTQVLTADAAQSTGVKWATPAAILSSGDEFSNGYCVTSVSGNALTVALKTVAGTDPSASDPIRIGFRSTTGSAGTYSQVSVTAATSVTISSGSTLGMTNSVQAYLRVYAAYNSGSGVEIGVINGAKNQDATQTTTAEGGAGAADSQGVLYATSTRNPVAIRQICAISITETTVGTWASNATQVAAATTGPSYAGAVYSGTNLTSPVDFAEVTCGTAGSAINRQSGSWTIANTATAGQCTITFSNSFSQCNSAPVCSATLVGSVTGSAGRAGCFLNADPSTSTLTLQRSIADANANGDCHVVCFCVK